MIKQEEITSIIVDGVEYSAFRLGTKDGGMPNHLFQGDRKEGMLIHDGEISPWSWTSIHYEENDRFVYFPKMDIHSLEEISTTKRSHAMKIVRNIAAGLSTGTKDFLNLETGVFPLYRIFIIGEEDVLLLPPDIGTVIGLLRTPEQRKDEVNALIKKGNEESFLLIAEMAELLYFALTGFLPYIDEKVRHWKYKEFPLENALGFMKEKLDEKTLGFINFILHAKRQQMRDIGGNRSSSEALAWFNKHSATLFWEVEDRNGTPDLTKAPEWADWDEKTGKGAKKNTFWRKKGTIIISCSVIAAIVLWLVGGWVIRALEPPLTKDCTQEEIVLAVYEAQNTLNPDLLDTAVKGISLPQDLQVINLFVTTRVRGAYEAVSPIMAPDTWIELGCPDIPQGNMIFGVRDIKLERIDENTITATALWYEPWNGDQDDEDYDPMAIPTSLKVAITPVAQTFKFEWNKRGWWNIVWTDAIELDEPEIIDIPFLPAPGQPAPQQLPE